MGINIVITSEAIDNQMIYCASEVVRIERCREFGVKETAKNSQRVRPEDLRALKSFAEDYPKAQLYLLYRGKDRLLQDGVLCIPCEEFLLALKPDRFPN